MAHHEMNTRSRQRQTSSQGSQSPTLNGSFTSSSTADSVTDGLPNTRHTNGTPSPSRQGSKPVKRRRTITRVSVNTWNMIIRKWEIPRKTLHVSIGMEDFFVTVFNFRIRCVVSLQVGISTSGYCTVACLYLYSRVFR